MDVFDHIASHSELGDVSSEIVECIKDAFDMLMPVDEILPEIKGDRIWIERNDSGRLISFSAVSIGTPNNLIENCNASTEIGCYFSAAVVAKTFQGKGIYKAVNRERVRYAVDLKSPIIFTQTQNPRVEEGIGDALEEVRRQGLVRKVSLQRVYMKEAYGRMLTAEVPEGRTTKYNHLSYEKGDAYILLFELEY